jgi:EmrB/QacA subfamily drug resistance transporter
MAHDTATRTEMADREDAAGFHNLSRRQLIGTIIGLQLTLLLAALDQTIVSTAMPSIIGQLNGFERYAWVTTSFMLTSTIAVPIFGKLSDIYGRKWFFLGGSVLFVLASALCGAAGQLPLPGDGMNQLIAFRGLQGLAAGIITGLTFTIIGDIFPPAERGKYQGLFAAIWGLASVFGPTLGGWITDNLSWRWVFYVNLPVGAAAIAVVFFAFPYFRPRGVRRAIDWAGVATLTAGLVPLLLALTWAGDLRYGWGAPRVLAFFAIAAVMLAAFLAVERRAAEPILPLSLFRSPVIAISLVALFLSGVGMFGAILFLPLFMQQVIGVSATQSGSLLTPMMLMLVVGSIVSGQLISRLGRYKVLAVVGMAIMAAGLALLAGMGADTTRTVVVRNMMVVGIGLGLVMPLYTLVVQNAAPQSQIGVATAATQFFRSIGGTVGAAVLSSVLLGRYNDFFARNAPAGAAPDLLAAFRDPLRLGQLLPGLRTNLAQTPGGAQLLQALLDNVRAGLVHAVNGVFTISAVIVALACVLNLFLKDIPLRKSFADDKGPEAAGAPGAERATARRRAAAPSLTGAEQGDD